MLRVVPCVVGDYRAARGGLESARRFGGGQHEYDVRRRVALWVVHRARRETRGYSRLDYLFLRRAQRSERLGKLAQRDDAERALQLADSVVDAEAELALRAAVVLFAVDVAVVVVAVHAEPCVMVVGEYHARLADCQRFVRVEAPRAAVSDSAERAAFVRAAHDLAGVLDYRDVVFFAERDEFIHVRRDAEHVYRHYRLRARRDELLRRCRVERECIVELAEYGYGVAGDYRLNRSDEGEGRRYHLVAGLHANALERSYQRRRAARNRERVLRARYLPRRGLELLRAVDARALRVRAVAVYHPPLYHVRRRHYLFFAENFRSRHRLSLLYDFVVD